MNVSQDEAHELRANFLDTKEKSDRSYECLPSSLEFAREGHGQAAAVAAKTIQTAFIAHPTTPTPLGAITPSALFLSGLCTQSAVKGVSLRHLPGMGMG